MPEFYIDPRLAARYHRLSADSDEMLAKDRANFRIKRSSVERVEYFRKKWGMGSVPYSGRLVVYTSDGKHNEFILLGRQNADEIRRRLLDREV